MNIMRATVVNSADGHQATLSTNGQPHPLEIAPKAVGRGSSTNGAELLFLALATCYCNDIFREAGKRGITVHCVQVEVEGEFAPEAGSRAENVRYAAVVSADASEADILALMAHTDTVAEIQNTLRAATPVTLIKAQAIPTS